METAQRTPLLLLLLALPHVCSIQGQNCSSLSETGLTCYNDYNRNITCVWSRTNMSHHPDSVCMIHAERLNKYSNSCKLEPVEASRPEFMRCSVVFRYEWIFQTYHILTINVSCNGTRRSLINHYSPICHMKLNPPPKPRVNSTSVSWWPQAAKHRRVNLYRSELQWRQGDQAWSDRPLYKQCEWDCEWTARLPEAVTRAARCDVRVRVQSVEYSSVWSDWSPVASWVAPSGGAKSLPLDVPRLVVGAFVCVVVLPLLFVLFKADKATWTLIARKIRGPPIPNPGKSFLQDPDFQSWLSPHFTGESFSSFLKPVEVASIEVTFIVDAVAPSGSEATLREKMGSKEIGFELTGSSFSNPIYPHVSHPAALVSSLAAGTLEACDPDTPYGPVGHQDEGEHAEQDADEKGGKDADFLELLSKGRNSSELIEIISDYMEAAGPRLEHPRLHSLDSGVCSGEEVSQESLEADSVNMTDSQEEGTESKEERKGGDDFQSLLGVSWSSIKVCSGYEQAHRSHTDIPALPGLDSGTSSGGEEKASREEDLESTRLLVPPVFGPSDALAGSWCWLTPRLPGSGLQTLPSHTLEGIALQSSSSPVEPSGDGYMPVGLERA